MKRNGDNLRDFWDIKCTKIRITRIPEEGEGEGEREGGRREVGGKRGPEKTVEEIIVENLPEKGNTH